MVSCVPDLAALYLQNPNDEHTVEKLRARDLILREVFHILWDLHRLELGMSLVSGPVRTLGSLQVRLLTTQFELPSTWLLGLTTVTVD